MYQAGNGGLLAGRQNLFTPFYHPALFAAGTPLRQVYPRHNAKNPDQKAGVSALYDAWQFPTLAWGDPTLPSALRRFTSEF
uniref:hypothetical protein n=1 Tax=Erwinia psidii TaxID=69224 RepID=UPI00226B15C2